MMTERTKLISQIEQAMDLVKTCVANNDSRDTVDWLATVSLRVAELNATFMTDIRNI